jgi:hypothetical protein
MRGQDGDGKEERSICFHCTQIKTNHDVVARASAVIYLGTSVLVLLERSPAHILS